MNGGGIDRGLVIEACEDGADFGGEGEGAVVEGIVEGFDAHGVAGDEEALAWGVPDGDGEHAVEFIEDGIAPLEVTEDDDFGIGVAEERVTEVEEFLADFEIVIDFAIEDHPDIARGIGHGLVTSGGEIEDGESAEGEAEGAIEVEAIVIGAAVGESAGHFGESLGVGGGAGGEVELADDTAHEERRGWLVGGGGGWRIKGWGE